MINKSISQGTPVQSKRDPPASAGNVSADEGISVPGWDGGPCCAASTGETLSEVRSGRACVARNHNMLFKDFWAICCMHSQTLSNRACWISWVRGTEVKTASASKFYILWITIRSWVRGPCTGPLYGGLGRHHQNISRRWRAIEYAFRRHPLHSGSLR
jgi:hypothetical protein